MNSAGLFAAHLPGSSPVHRAPLWLKVTGVLAVGVVPWLTHSLAPLLVTLGLVLAVAALAQLPPRRLARSLRAIAPVLVLLLAFQWWAQGPTYAVGVVLGIANAYLAAGILTATTPVTDLLDGVVRGARPLRRLVDPEVVALTLAVVVRSVPWVAGSFTSVRDAARARGLERSPRAVVVPAALRVVAYARSTGEALAARGLTDPDEPEHPDDRA
ncbi:energy-coupling factor transporter transmembrane component T [Intrasporangium sp. YIM S08009]|uniref:energy-coupling factor transporter transmembrane component T family protein n=1 Tax=Intrasporangium zincisolvens TaxID=3080018 RepID=UPI002B051D1F|nr:energy-coupling factor transporter transmembrane component T [Intrasporangium sp. YIM S08009]